MKHFVFLILILGAKANAACETSKIKLTLNEGSSNACVELRIESEYATKLCSDGTGEMKGEGGSLRYLFGDQEQWFARQDLLDFSNNQLTTEILALNIGASTFVVQNKVVNRDTVLSDITCYGSVIRMPSAPL